MNLVEKTRKKDLISDDYSRNRVKNIVCLFKDAASAVKVLQRMFLCRPGGGELH
jgi:hypothetical protein